MARLRAARVRGLQCLYGEFRPSTGLFARGLGPSRVWRRPTFLPVDVVCPPVICVLGYFACRSLASPVLLGLRAMLTPPLLHTGHCHIHGAGARSSQELGMQARWAVAVILLAAACGVAARPCGNVTILSQDALSAYDECTSASSLVIDVSAVRPACCSLDSCVDERQ